MVLFDRWSYGPTNGDQSGGTMLEPLSDLPDSVLGFRASGELTAEDYRTVLEPAVAAALKTRDKLRLLYILGEDLDGLSAGAAWQDTKSRHGAHHSMGEGCRGLGQGLAPTLGSRLRLPDSRRDQGLRDV